MDIWDKIDAIIDKRNNESQNDSTQKVVKKKIDISLKIYHTRSGTYIDISNIPMEFIKKIKNYYTISNKNIMGYFEHTSLWQHKGTKLYVPRFGSHFLDKKFKNVLFDNKITCDNPLPDMTYTGKLNAGNQEVVFAEIMSKFSTENIEKGRAGLIINLQAGQGKTFLAMYMMGQLKVRTLVVVHNENMLNQWFNLLTEKFPNNTTGKYYGKKKILGDNMVGIINSLVKNEINIKGLDNTNPIDFFSRFDLIILDECHLYSSKENRKIYNVAQTPYMLGLSATPDENDRGWDKINNWCVGPVLTASELPGFVSNETAFKGVVTKVSYSGHPSFTETIVNEKLDLVSVPLMVEQLCCDPYRLQMIIDLVLEQHKKGMNVLVFADRRSYLAKILENLEKNKLTGTILDNEDDVKNSIEAFNIMGGSSEKEFDLAKEKGNIILSTYQYMSTGISIQRLNSIVLTTPRKSKSRQIINRIFRLGSDESITRQIVDIVDVKISLKNQWYKRKEYYDEQCFTINEQKKNWKEFE